MPSSCLLGVVNTAETALVVGCIKSLCGRKSSVHYDLENHFRVGQWSNRTCKYLHIFSTSQAFER